jgi:hypothetical protein
LTTGAVCFFVGVVGFSTRPVLTPIHIHQFRLRDEGAKVRRTTQGILLGRLGLPRRSWCGTCGRWSTAVCDLLPNLLRGSADLAEVAFDGIGGCLLTKELSDALVVDLWFVLAKKQTQREKAKK